MFTNKELYMTINIPLLRKAIEFAEASAARQRTFAEVDPKEYPADEALDYRSDPSSLVWNQGNWSNLKHPIVESAEQATLEHCGTAFCLAGFVAAQLDGYEAKLETHQLNDDGKLFVQLIETIDGKTFRHSEVARNALGLNQHQAETLFSGNNDVHDVRRIAEHYAGETL